VDKFTNYISLKVGGRKSEVRSRKSKVGSQKSEVGRVVKKIAEIKKLPLEETQEQLLKNTKHLFKI
jgi:Tat protein secretion system quality control protein TatD with DNase activity